MSNTPSQLVFWPHFERELKRLKRKYPSLNKDTHYSTAPHCQTDGCPEIPIAPDCGLMDVPDWPPIGRLKNTRGSGFQPR